MPNTVGLAAFDDLKGGGIVECWVGCFEPFADVGGVHDLGERVKETNEFRELLFGGSTGFITGSPFGDSAWRISGQPGYVATNQVVALTKFRDAECSGLI